MRIPADPKKIEIRGRYNSQTKQHEPPGTTVYHQSNRDLALGVTELGIAENPLPDSGRNAYRGEVRAPHADEVPNVARCPHPEYLGSSSWYAIRDLTTEAAEATPPAPKREPRPITGKPRIIRLVDGRHADANAEGCQVIVDDLAAIEAALKKAVENGGKLYAGPPGSLDYDFIQDLAGLPGRKSLVVTDQAGKPISPPRTLSGITAVFDDVVLGLSADFATTFHSWTDAERAIDLAYERGLLK